MHTILLCMEAMSEETIDYSQRSCMRNKSHINTYYFIVYGSFVPRCKADTSQLPLCPNTLRSVPHSTMKTLIIFFHTRLTFVLQHSTWTFNISRGSKHTLHGYKLHLIHLLHLLHCRHLKQQTGLPRPRVGDYIKHLD